MTRDMVGEPCLVSTCVFQVALIQVVTVVIYQTGWPHCSESSRIRVTPRPGARPVAWACHSPDVEEPRVHWQLTLAVATLPTRDEGSRSQRHWIRILIRNAPVTKTRPKSDPFDPVILTSPSHRSNKNSRDG